MAVEQLGRPTGALVVMPAVEPPARFENYPAEVVERAFELWSTIAGRHGARTLRLLRTEFGEDASLPTASTVRRWASEGAWAAKADANLEQSHGRTVFELQVGWLSGLRLAQQTLLDAMAGELDDLPFGGAGRLKAAEITLRTIERLTFLAILPQPPEPERADTSDMPREEREALAKRAIARGPRGRRL